MDRLSSRRWACLAAAALGGLSAGCNALAPDTSSCDRWSAGEELIAYSDGAVEDGVYRSARWDCPEDAPVDPACELLYFPGGVGYRIEHGLGVAPRWWQVYLSFSRYGAHGGSFAEATGNQAEVVSIDAEHLDVTNGSCVDYWMLIVAGAGAP